MLSLDCYWTSFYLCYAEGAREIPSMSPPNWYNKYVQDNYKKQTKYSKFLPFTMAVERNSNEEKTLVFSVLV